eukprot:4128166-Amphidinium_carterae.1
MTSRQVRSESSAAPVATWQEAPPQPTLQPYASMPGDDPDDSHVTAQSLLRMGALVTQLVGRVTELSPVQNEVQRLNVQVQLIQQQVAQ